MDDRSFALAIGALVVACVAVLVLGDEIPTGLWGFLAGILTFITVVGGRQRDRDKKDDE